MTKTFTIIENETGGVAVIDVDRYHEAAKTLRRRAEDALKEEGLTAKDKKAKSDALYEKAAEVEGELKDIQRKSREVTFELRGFTRRERLRAKKDATTWQGDKAHVDEDAYDTALMAISTGKTLSEIEELPDGLATVLREAVVEATYPNPSAVLKHRFLLLGAAEGTN